MEDLPDTGDILSALEQSGFLLEQRVASALDEAGFSVRLSAAYRDPDEDKPREIDVIGMRRIVDRAMNRRQAWQILVIECKSSPMPHVAFLRRWNNSDRKRLPWEFYLTAETPGKSRIVDEWAIHRVNTHGGRSKLCGLSAAGRASRRAAICLSAACLQSKPRNKYRRTFGELGGEVSVISFPAAVVGGPVYSVTPTIADGGAGLRGSGVPGGQRAGRRVDRPGQRLVHEDDGQGMAAGRIEARHEEGHLGLHALGELLTDAGGSLALHSAPDAGTRVDIQVPAP